MPGAQTFLFVCCFNHFLVHFAVARRMGCAISGLAPKTAGETKTEDAVAHLSKEQIEMIKESWKVIQEDIAKVGIIMFVRLFETHPECKDVFFLFRDVEDLDRLRTSRELRAHGLRVMSFIEKSVARLDQLERLEVLAVELGRSHYRYNAPPKYYSYVGAEFICAVQPILKERWTPELEEAWKAYEPGLPGEEQTSPGGNLPQGEEHSLIRDLDGLNSELVEQA